MEHEWEELARQRAQRASWERFVVNLTVTLTAIAGGLLLAAYVVQL